MFNSSDFTTLEVKFNQSDLLEDSKKRALEAYDENNKCLGLVFNTGIDAFSENSDLEEDCLPEVPKISISKDIHALSDAFKETLTLLKNSELSKAEDLGKHFGLFSPDHPSISFLPKHQQKRRDQLAQSRNHLPWTSADSIHIFPL